MTRQDLVNEILGIPLPVLHMPSDCFQLVQDHWNEGNTLFDSFYLQDWDRARTLLDGGNWSDKELKIFLTQLQHAKHLHMKVD